MTTFWSLLYLAVLVALFCHVVAEQSAGLARKGNQTSAEHRAEARTGGFLVAFIVVFAVFFGSFFVLGFVELFSGLRIVGVLTATLVGIFAGTVFWFLTHRTRPHQFAIVGTSANGHDASATESHDQGETVSNLASRMAIVTMVTFAFLTVLTLFFGFPRGTEGGAKYLPVALHIFKSSSLMTWDVQHTVPANVSIYLGYFLEFVPEFVVGVLGSLTLEVIRVVFEHWVFHFGLHFQSPVSDSGFKCYKGGTVERLRKTLCVVSSSGWVENRQGL